ncbi:OmpA family protein [Desulfobacter curvatus]|uniref:OmpA family protein n=1 Tax=Desulfobacter curvatus TaxID=2290 RepID=UPI000375A3C7|nr:OmpA family protein [Desulfobacter curvatus]
MKCNSEKATRPAMFSIALALTAGFLVFTLCVPITATATDADAIERQDSSINVEAPVPSEAIATENQNIATPVPEEQDAAAPALEAEASETDENLVDESPMPMDSEQSPLDKQRQQFLSRQIFFAFNSCQLDEQAQALAREQAAWLAANPEVSVEIIGYCDQSGPQDYNMALGEKRANAVKTFLVNLGIAPQRLTEVSYGEKSPIRTTTDQTAARINRRVEFRIQPAA